MRITIVQGAFLPVPPIRGGAIEKAFYALAREFAGAGHAVKYISRRCDGLPVQQSETPNLGHDRIRGHDAPKNLLALKCLDLLYSLRARRKLPDADILLTHTFWLPILARNPRHGKLYVHVGRTPRGQMTHYRHAARLQTVSSPIAKLIQQELPQQLAHLAKVLPYPLDPAFLAPGQSTPARRKTLLYTGRIHPEKGLDLLVPAYLGLPEHCRNGWLLKIIGPWRTEHGGAGLPYLESLKIKAENSPDIQFAEPVFEQGILVQEYDQATVFAYPSLAEKGETFGLAALEAMSRGCITLVSALDCFQDFLTDGNNGFIFNHRVSDPVAELTAQLNNLLDNSDNLLHVGKKAVATAEDYSPASIANAFVQDFEQILQQP